MNYKQQLEETIQALKDNRYREQELTATVTDLQQMVEAEEKEEEANQTSKIDDINATIQTLKQKVKELSEATVKPHIKDTPSYSRQLSAMQWCQVSDAVLSE